MPNNKNLELGQEHIPYFQPSPARIIDAKLDHVITLIPKEMYIKSRIFTDKLGNNIEVFETRNFGPCKCSGHRWNQLCPYCILNCVHKLNINNIYEVRVYSHLEVLIMQM